MSIRLLIILFAFALAGCQTPRTIYTNGVIIWCSRSAVGFGFGEYIEVPAGGELYRSVTNSAPCVWNERTAYSSSDISIKNQPILEPQEKTGKEEAADADKTEVD